MYVYINSHIHIQTYTVRKYIYEEGKRGNRAKYFVHVLGYDVNKPAIHPACNIHKMWSLLAYPLENAYVCASACVRACALTSIFNERYAIFEIGIHTHTQWKRVQGTYNKHVVLSTKQPSHIYVFILQIYTCSFSPPSRLFLTLSLS